MRNRYELDNQSSSTNDSVSELSTGQTRSQPRSRHRLYPWILTLLLLPILVWIALGKDTAPSSPPSPAPDSEKSVSSSGTPETQEGGGIWDPGESAETDWWDPLMEWEPPEEPPATGTDPTSSTSTASILHNNWHNPDLTRHPPARQEEQIVVDSEGQVTPPPEENQHPPVSDSPSDSDGWSVWFPSWEQPQAIERLEEAQDQMNELHLMGYDLNLDGTVTSFGGEEMREAVSFARKHGIRVIPTIGNRFSPSVTQSILHDTENREQAVEQIMTLVQTHKYDGVNILFQPMEETERDVFADWLQSLANRLHAEEKTLAVTVYPQTGQGDSHPVQRAQDWQRIGQAADQVIIMAYNYSWGTPGPSTPLDWLDQVIKHAKEQIEPSNITIALSTIGWVWPEENPEAQRAFSYATYTSAVNQSEAAPPPPQRDENGELYVTIEHQEQHYQAWYMDKTSLETKIDWINTHHPDIGGVALWGLGNEDPEIWDEDIRLPGG